MKRLLQRLFNLPPFDTKEYLTDKQGEKFWVVWTTHAASGPKLMLFYRGWFVGTVESIIDENGSLELTDVIMFDRRYHLRNRGLGKAMLHRFFAYAREKGFHHIWGRVKPHEGSTEEYLVEWYHQQGFDVIRTSTGGFLIERVL